MDTLDRRLEAVAARLELHTSNLAADQRDAIREIDRRLQLDVAVVSEHLLSMERLAAETPAPPGSLVSITWPGESLVIPEGHAIISIWSYRANTDQTWTRVENPGEDTLRIAAVARTD